MLLRTSFESHLMVGVKALPTYSIRIESPSDAGLRTLHALYEGCNPITRSRSARQTVNALRYALGTRQAKETRETLLSVPAQVLTLDHRAVLLPPRTPHLPTPAVKGMIEEGYRRLVTQEALVDVEAADLLIPDPFPLDEQTAVQLLEESWDRGSLPSEPTPGRYEIAGWVFDAFGRPPVDSRATALARALGMVRVDEQRPDVPTIITALARIIAHVPVTTADDTSVLEVLGQAFRILAPGVPKP